MSLGHLRRVRTQARPSDVTGARTITCWKSLWTKRAGFAAFTSHYDHDGQPQDNYVLVRCSITRVLEKTYVHLFSSKHRSFNANFDTLMAREPWVISDSCGTQRRFERSLEPSDQKSAFSRSFDGFVRCRDV